MAVHMVQIRCEKPDSVAISRIRTEISNWAGRHDEALPEQRIETVERNTEPDGSGTPFCKADYRFHWGSESKTQLMDTVEQVLQQFVDWYQIKYHVCDHDDESRTGCSWDDVREYGPVPSDLD